jgi:hypothetical protein
MSGSARNEQVHARFGFDALFPDLGRTTYSRAVRDGRLALTGAPALTRHFATWFRASPFAEFDRGGQKPSARA